MNETKRLSKMIMAMVPWYKDDIREAVENILEEYPNETCVECKLINIMSELGIQKDEAYEKMDYYRINLWEENKNDVKDAINDLMKALDNSAYVIGNSAMKQALLLLTENSIRYCGESFTDEVIGEAFEFMNEHN